MKTYRFFERSTRGGFTQWAVAYDEGKETARLDREVYTETVRQFRQRVSGVFEAQGYAYDAGQYCL